MSFRNVVKEGWHPKGRDGGKESWRGDFKGINQVAGWMGKGKEAGVNQQSAHVSRPLSTLKDPSSFGPPPKNVNYHGGAALPNEITPDRGGWGAPLAQDQLQSATRAASAPVQEKVEEPPRPAGPPLPYRADRTGLRTDHLPPPPAHRDLNRSPAPPIEAQPAKPKPGLPPRLPSRQNTASSVTAPMASPPPAYDSLPATQPNSSQSNSNYGINQAAVSRLGNAGVSVPGLGIGNQASNNPWQGEKSQSTLPKSPSPNPRSSPAPALNQLSELQSRFARMGSSSGSNPQPATPSHSASTQSPPPLDAHAPQQQQTAQGTTWAEKQAALRTASNFQKDPSTVSMADARTAATTANSFRERHKEDIAAAGQRASQFNKKYNVTGKLNNFLEKHSSPSSETPPQLPQQQPPQQTQHAVGAQPVPAAHLHDSQVGMAAQGQQSPEFAASISRKPPPPPPPKKPANMHGNLNGNGTTASPPPVPLGTKPSYA